MTVTSYITKDYENICLRRPSQNKANSNPIKPNLLDAQMNVSKVLTKEYENVPLRRRGENKAKQTQFQTQPYLAQNGLGKDAKDTTIVAHGGGQAVVFTRQGLKKAAQNHPSSLAQNPHLSIPISASHDPGSVTHSLSSTHLLIYSFTPKPSSLSCEIIRVICLPR